MSDLGRRLEAGDGAAPQQEQLDPKVSISLHPMSLKRYAEGHYELEGSTRKTVIAPLAVGPGSEVTKPALTSAIAALQRGYDTASAIHQAKQAVNMNPQVADEAADSMTRAYMRAGPPFDHAEAEIANAEAALTKRMNAVLSDPNAEKLSRATNAQEIRAHIKALFPNQPERRSMWVHDRIVNGDKNVMWAVLNASCWTSGLDDKQFENLRLLAEQTHCRDDFERKWTLGKLRDRLNDAKKALRDRYGADCPRESAARDNSRTALQKLEALR